MMKKNVYKLTYIMNKDNSIELDKEENIFTGEDLKKAGIQLDNKLLKEIFFKITKTETEGVLSWRLTNLQSSGKELYLNYIKNLSKDSEICLKKEETHQLKDLLDEKIYLNKTNESWDYFLFEKVIKEVPILLELTKKEIREDEPMNINFDDLGLLDDLFYEKKLDNNKQIDDPEKCIPLEIGGVTKPRESASDKYHITFYQKSQKEKDFEEEEKQRKEIFDDLKLEQLLNEYEESDQEREIKKNRQVQIADEDSEFFILNSDEANEIKKPVKKIIVDDEEDQNFQSNNMSEPTNNLHNQIDHDDKINLNKRDVCQSIDLNNQNSNIESSYVTTTPFKARPDDHEESITNSELDRILEVYNNQNITSNSEVKKFSNFNNYADNNSKFKSQISRNPYNHNSQHGNISSHNSNLNSYRVNINIGGKNSQSNNTNNFMPVINLNEYNSSNFDQTNIQTHTNIPYIRSSIKQRRQEWQQSTKKFGGEWNSHGKRSSQRSESDFISAFKSKRLKKATDNKELQIELNTTCAICLDTINQLANLDNCTHDFCRPCIVQWSKNTNLCPLCKKEFKKIIYYEKNKKKELKVKKKKLQVEEEGFELLDEFAEESADNCMVCAGSNDFAHMLVCDGCHYNVCHTYCDGLNSIPENDWFCSTCRSRQYASNIIRDIIRDVDLTNEDDDDESYSPRILLEEEEDVEGELQESEEFNDVVRIIGQDVESQIERPRRRRRRNNNNIRVDIRVNVNMSDRRTNRRRNRTDSSNSNNQINSSVEARSNTFSIGSNLNNIRRNSRARTRSNHD
jgi:hypothetical protein